MADVMICERLDGGVSVVGASEWAVRERWHGGRDDAEARMAILTSGLPTGATKARAVDQADIPTDRTKRSEWRLSPDGGQIRDAAGTPIKDLPARAADK